METKTCQTCKQSKSVNDFGSHNRKKGKWIGSYIKQCLNNKNRQYYHEHIDVINTQVICECGSLQIQT